MDEKEGIPAFPIDFNECPNCGSTERLIGSIMKQQVKEGKARPGMLGATIIYQLPVFDPVRQPFSYPVVTAVVDVCAQCGTLYCVHAECKTEYSMKPTGKN